jgi:hypothetical protein
MTLRRFPALLVFLLLGAIMNALVAWRCSLAADFNVYTSSNWPPSVKLVRQERESTSSEHLPPSTTRMHCSERERLLRLGWIPRGDFLPRKDRTDMDRRLTSKTLATTGLRTRKVWEDEFTSDVGHVREVSHQVWSGWPLVSLYGECNIVGLSGSQWKDRWLIRHRPPTDPISRLIPYRPALPGFAVNSIFYASILWTVSYFFIAMWRMNVGRIRVRRGLCPACAYPIGKSDVCTECGQEFGQ